MSITPRVKELVGQGDRLFAARRPLLSVWQTMAENFYPMRADFTTSHTLGDEFASHLMTGRPLLAHRDLGNAISSMLRPRGKPWFRARTHDDTVNEDAGSAAWLDEKTGIMQKLMYDRRSGFVRATKQGDNDFVAFGQAVIEPSINSDASGLLYRSWHLRDCVWCENAELMVDVFHRNWKIEARELIRLFPQTVSPKVRQIVEKEPYKEILCRHIVMPSDSYDFAGEGKKVSKERFPFVSIVVDVENETILEETPRKRLGYVIPRWLTVSGSQYAYSPATVIALPDARMLQAMALTLLEAGQKAVDPPLKATQEAIVGGVNFYAGGISWVDRGYDEKMGAALEPLMDPPHGLNWGEAREAKIEEMIAEAFFLNKIALPPAQVDGDMTKWEAQQRVEEYIRGALPLFEPMEVEYNGALCEETFHLCMEFGAFGSDEEMLQTMPQRLQGQDIRWQFESPLQAAQERGKAEAFIHASNLLATAAGLDPTVRHDFDISKAFRNAVPGTGAPANWLVPEDQAKEAKEADAQQAAMAAAAQTVSAGADIAGKVGDGAQQLQAAGLA